MSLLPPNLGGFGASPGVPLAGAQPPRHGSTYDFDFDAGQFVTSGGEVVVLVDQPSLLQAIEKSLRTRRYTYLAYDHDYGTDLLRVATGPLPLGNERSTLMTMWAAETILSDRRVRAVANLAILAMYSPDRLRITADVTDSFGAVLALDVTVPL